MLIGEIISVALGALRANKLRSLLTMLGIVIGVGAVIAVVALGTGAQQAVKDRIAALGTTLLTVNPGQQRGGGGGAIAGGAAAAHDRRRQGRSTSARPTLLAVQPEMRSMQQVVYGNKNASTQIIGTTPNYLEVRKYALKAGRMFTAADDEGRQRVAVVGIGRRRQPRHHDARGADRRERAHSRHAVHGHRRARLEGSGERVSGSRTTRCSSRSTRRASA